MWTIIARNYEVMEELRKRVIAKEFTRIVLCHCKVKIVWLSSWLKIGTVEFLIQWNNTTQYVMCDYVIETHSQKDAHNMLRIVFVHMDIHVQGKRWWGNSSMKRQHSNCGPIYSLIRQCFLQSSHSVLVMIKDDVRHLNTWVKQKKRLPRAKN